MRPCAFLLLMAFTGCASSLSTLQTGKPLKRGQVQVMGGAGVFVPAGQLLDVIKVGYDSREVLRDAVRREQLPAEERLELERKLLTAGIALVVAPPGVNNEFSLRAGLMDELDVGLRYSGVSLRLDAKYRLLHRGDPETMPEYQRRSVDVAVGLGLSRHLFQSPALEVLKVVRIDDFSRYDVEIPLYVSGDIGGIVTLYAAPKYIYGRTSLDQRLVDYAQEGSERTGLELGLPSFVNSHFVGSSAGFAVGYKYVHLFAELTAGYTFCSPHVFGARRELGGVTLYPAFGIALKNGEPSVAHR